MENPDAIAFTLGRGPLLVDMHLRPGDAIDWIKVERLWDAGGLSSPDQLKSAKDFALANGLLQARDVQWVGWRCSTNVGNGPETHLICTAGPGVPSDRVLTHRHVPAISRGTAWRRTDVAPAHR